MTHAFRSIFEVPGPRVFTVPPAVSFLDALAGRLLDELDRPDAPFALSDAIILLPTRRAARALSQAFLNQTNAQATLLPKIRTLGDVDPDDAGLAELSEPLDVVPAISPFARRMILAKLIRARDRKAEWTNDPVSALSAADALADLLDSAAMTANADQGFDWKALETLVENKELAAHWEQSTQFLKIITEAWPNYLANAGFVDPGTAQRRRIEQLVSTWQANPPQETVILAGSTGSMPTTRALMHLVARLDRGAIVLPGLDRDLSPEAWKAARRDDQHPQRAMAEALETIGIAREDVLTLPGVIEPPDLAQRRVVLNEALTPQASTADWPSRIESIGQDNIVAGLRGLTLIEAHNEEEEATLIAASMRESLQNPGRSVALVTPDQSIARRVAAKMMRWGIRLDLSSGTPLTDTMLGTFMRLTALWLLDPADPVSLISLLSHPLTALSLERAHLRDLSFQLEINLLRGARKDQSLADLGKRIKALPEKRWKTGKSHPEKLREQLLDLVCRLDAIATTAIQTSAHLSIYSRTWAQAVELLATTPQTSGAEEVWRGEAGTSAAQFFANLLEHGGHFDTISPSEAVRLFEALLAEQIVRPRGTEPRAAILGPLEARLLKFDKIILAGLDEGVWPQAATADPFLSRPMRQALGLPSPDARVGLSAHDFAQFASAPSVWMTRSGRRGNAPAVMSRWLWRLKTLATGALGLSGVEEALRDPENWQRRLAASEPHREHDPLASIPRPTPPTDARPRQLSATQIETWIRDPYRLYVEKVLHLRALDPLGGLPGASERGTSIHAALEIVGDWPTNRPEDPYQALRQGLALELKTAGYTGFRHAVEMQRLEATLDFFAAFEAERLEQGIIPLVEQEGKISLEIDGHELILTARADRIDVGPTGVEIMDFKSNEPPTLKQVAKMFAPQLPVTALIADRGGFDDSRITTPTALMHIRVGGKKPGLREASSEEHTVESLIAAIEGQVRKLFVTYNVESKPYLSKPRVQYIKPTTYEDATDRLARRAEWADTEGEE